MKLRQSMGRALAAGLGLVLAVSLLPAVTGAEESSAPHSHIWRTDWAIDDYHHWHGCADPSCRTLVPAWAEGYSYHVYDSPRDPDCNVCGWVRAVDPGHVHTWGSGWSQDSVGHWRPCSDPDCPGVAPGWAEGYARHTYSSDTDPDCDVCGWVRALVPGHTHVWTEQWSGDGQGHWRACAGPDCPGVVPGEGKDYGAHVYSGSQDPDCDICGRNRYTDPNHTHVWGTGWNGDGVHHWKRCTDPDCPGVVPAWAEGFGDHVYDSGQDTDCNICGRNRYVDPNHIHTWGTDWSGDDTHHWYACTSPGCPGVVPGEGKGYEAHQYDGDLDPDCNICGRFRVALPLSDGNLNRPIQQDSDITVLGRGRVAVRPTSPKAGDRMTVILTPEEHSAPSALTVTDQQGGTVEAVRVGDGIWTFSYPGEKVRLRAVFQPVYQTCLREVSCPLAAYGDLSPGQWYHDGIHFCLDWELMSGYDPAKFVPDGGLSGGMIAQIIYNMAGHPELPGKSGYESTDLWYDDAMAWAVGAGVMNAGGGQLFSPEADVTREQLAVMLWRCAGCPSVPGWSRTFPDAEQVTPWMEEGVRWAVDRGVLQGRDSGLLDPGGRITRAEAASVLVRFFQEMRTGLPDLFQRQ